jgi:uncharacterized membrane protein
MYLFLNLVFALIVGFGLSWFMYRQYRRETPFMCPMGNNCDEIMSSKWSTLLGYKNEVWSIAWYGVLLLLLLGAYLFPVVTAWLVILFVGAVAVGALYSVYLLCIELFVLKKMCFYCTLSFVVVMIVAVHTFLLL